MNDGAEKESDLERIFRYCIYILTNLCEMVTNNLSVVKILKGVFSQLDLLTTGLYIISNQLLSTRGKTDKMNCKLVNNKDTVVFWICTLPCHLPGCFVYWYLCV